MDLDAGDLGVHHSRRPLRPTERSDAPVWWRKPVPQNLSEDDHCTMVSGGRQRRGVAVGSGDSDVCGDLPSGR